MAIRAASSRPSEAAFSETKETRPLIIGKDIPARVQADGKSQGAITVLNSNVSPKDILKLQVLTDKGSVEAQW